MTFLAMCLRTPAILFCFLMFSGCASYYSHYAVFPAANSQGEPRQVKLSWQTAEYPGWWFAANQSTPIILETQCSNTVWHLVDPSHEAFRSEGDCGDGIRACGRTGQDRLASSSELVDKAYACVRITSQAGANRITDLGRQFELTVACNPVEAARKVAGEEENLDYVRASVVPYAVQSRKVARGSLSGRVPALDDAVCTDE